MRLVSTLTFTLAAIGALAPRVEGGSSGPGGSLVAPDARFLRQEPRAQVLVDDNGNLTDDATRVLVWDAFNRLVAVARKSDGAAIAAYSYLPDGRRSRKVVFSQTNPGVVEREVRFAWDGAQEVEEQNAAGVTLATFVWSPVYVDELVEFRREAAHPLGAGSFYAHQDVRCDVVAVTNASGVVVEKRRYDDFGREEIRDAGGAVVAASPSGLEYGFQGRRRDGETGWLYFRARFYDPEVGRFLSRDPVWDAGNVGGWYTFVGNGPLSGRDPWGLQDTRSAQEALLRTVEQHASHYSRMHNQLKKSPSTPPEALRAVNNLYITFERMRWDLLRRLGYVGKESGISRDYSIERVVIGGVVRGAATTFKELVIDKLVDETAEQYLDPAIDQLADQAKQELRKGSEPCPSTVLPPELLKLAGQLGLTQADLLNLNDFMVDTAADLLKRAMRDEAKFVLEDALASYVGNVKDVTPGKAPRVGVGRVGPSGEGVAIGDLPTHRQVAADLPRYKPEEDRYFGFFLDNEGKAKTVFPNSSAGNFIGKVSRQEAEAALQRHGLIGPRTVFSPVGWRED